MDAARELIRMVNGYQVSQALHVAAVLRLSDLIADGARDVADLASATGTDAPTLARLMRALGAIGVYRQGEDGRYSCTELGAALRSDAPQPVQGWAAFIGRPYYWQAWSGLLDSVRTGENSFRATHGIDVWRYREQHPEESAIFDAAMVAGSRHVARSVIEGYDFAGIDTVADIGGGRGGLLAEVLAAYPSMRGILFDRADVVAGAAAVLAARGVAERCTLVGGDFFESVPAGADAYLLKSIVHDWADEQAVAVLCTCRAAMTDRARMLLVERLVDGSADTAFSDLNMLVGPGGRERSADEYAALLARAGLTVARVLPTASGVSVIEARPS